jgi:hypothetical protein
MRENVFPAGHAVNGQWQITGGDWQKTALARRTRFSTPQ